ncbi:MAG: hypothetical protein ACT4O2_02630 [Beijerinckiaceae bacterium]
MTREKARASVKAGTIKMGGNFLTLVKATTFKEGNILTWLKVRVLKAANPLTLLFISGTLLMLASVIRMWSHWPEISASLGFHQAAGVLTVVTTAAFILAWWLNTDNR